MKNGRLGSLLIYSLQFVYFAYNVIWLGLLRSGVVPTVISHFPKTVLAILFASAMLLSACSQQQQQQGDDKSVISQQGALGVGTGLDLGTGAMYPGGFPIPQYPDSRVTTSTNTGSDGTKQTTRAVVLTSGDDMYKIGQYYQSKLTEGGWQIKHMSVMGNLLNMDAQKGTAKATINVTNNGKNFTIAGQNTGKTAISLVVVSKQ